MYDLLGLETRVVQVESAAGAGDRRVDLKPAEGEIWIVTVANGRHDNSAGALNCMWAFGLTASGMELDQVVSAVWTSRISCYAKSPLSANAYNGNMLPFVCDPINFLQWTTFSLLATKKGYIDAVVLVVRGVRRVTP